MDSWMGVDVRPLTLNKYVYVSADPVNKIDPSGNIEFNLPGLMSATNDNAILTTISSARVLRLAGSAAKAVALACIGQAVASTMGIEIPTSGSGGSSRGCEMNRMRVQLQQGSRFTIGKDVVGLPNPGVTVNEVRAKLLQLYLGRREDGWFPADLDQWMYQNIVLLSIRLGRFPMAGGVIEGGNILRRETFHRGKEYRIDIENLRGHNLRR